jgi:protein involved in polysaccharide export with SLBB domain
VLLVWHGAAFAQSGEVGVPGAESQSSVITAYRLGSGDKLRITVYNEEDVTGEYEVDSSGNVSLKLIGAVPAAGRTLPELTKVIEARLLDGYLLNPRVAIDVLNYRPFYVLGEVNEPGSYPYVSGITVLKAIALAGGYTFRARTNKIELMHANEPEKPILVDQNTPLLPGDIIRVKERFF